MRSSLIGTSVYLRTLTCPGCGRVFTTLNTRKHACSRTCKVNVSRRKARERSAEGDRGDYRVDAA